ncbi:SGNH/GDSL hydrolase family protein [Streptomyces sp. NPDC096324]|uniref:SGNH/GDSL hydrolase family protein n=1 Tax=Streptomyces sp. NPDC096324 TaxID=3366085 RepID=UPI00382C6393
MKKFRITAYVASALLAGATTLTGAATPATAAATGGYVALGDSYSSGVGAGNYIPSSGSCQRSTNAYPYLYNAAHPSSSFAFNACSGATTDDVLAKQLGSLNSSTSLVTITIGGNDAGFADVMRTCVLSIRSVCQSRVSTAQAYIASTMPGKLDRVYTAIRAKAPSARVVVLDYPGFYETGNISCLGLSDESRRKINQAVLDMDNVIRDQVRRHSFSLGWYSSVASLHRICSDDPWLNDVELGDTNKSYHPNAAGQRGYLSVLENYTFPLHP